MSDTKQKDAQPSRERLHAAATNAYALLSSGMPIPDAQYRVVTELAEALQAATPAPQGEKVYAALPEASYPAWNRARVIVEDTFTADQMRAFADATAALRAPGAGAQAGAAVPATDMVSVNKDDANNYCRILTALGMEEEGDPVAEVQRLLASAPAQAVAVPADEEIIALLGDPKYSTITAVREALRRWGAAGPARDSIESVAVRDSLRALIEAIEYTPLGLRAIRAVTKARAALAAAPSQEHATQLAGGASYSLDADPEGIRARAADAITDALARGFQDGEAPPAGHWLEPFWRNARFSTIQYNALRNSVEALLDAPALDAPSAPAVPDAGNWRELGYVSAAHYAEDMQAVGEAFLKAIEDNYAYLEAAGWDGPMDSPVEVIVDLLNLLDEAKAAALAAAPQAPAAPAAVFADWEMEGRDPVEMLDKIYAVYQRSMGKPSPDAEMVQVVSLTKDMLLAWWGEHRDSVRAAMSAAPAAPAVDAETLQKAAKYDHLLPYLCKTCGGYGLVDRRCADDPLGAEPCPDCNMPAPAVDAREDARDAVRYRFIRDVPYTKEVQSALAYQQNAVIDQVIDAAIAAQAKGADHG